VLDHEITFFEHMTALALWYFGREKVDWVVWETGWAGARRHHIVTPEICIITISGSITNIPWRFVARDSGGKAGIIKPGVPVSAR